MPVSLATSINLLTRTPRTLSAMLNGLPDEIISANEGENTWNPLQVVGHLVVCEETNFGPRIELILSGAKDKTFVPIDMTIHLHRFNMRSMQSLLDEFSVKRESNINRLKQHPLAEQLLLTGIHPKLGEVNVDQVIAAWVVHDHAHIVQAARIIARQYKEQAGPFIEFLRILT